MIYEENQNGSDDFVTGVKTCSQAFHLQLANSLLTFINILLLSNLIKPTINRILHRYRHVKKLLISAVYLLSFIFNTDGKNT